MTTTVSAKYNANVNVSITRKNGVITKVTTWQTGVPGSTDREVSVFPSVPATPAPVAQAVAQAPVREEQPEIPLNVGPEVRAAVQRLDEEAPGWWEKVNTRTLSMWDCDQCILGQAFREEAERDGLQNGYIWAIERGWCEGHLLSAAFTGHKYDWLHVIYRRRERRQQF